MVTIFVRTVNKKGEVSDPAICASEPVRKDAEAWLNKLVEQYKPTSGYDPEQDYWWIRNNDMVSRYTIGS